MWSALRLFSLAALVTVISLNIAGSPRKPRLSPSPQRIKKTKTVFQQINGFGMLKVKAIHHKEVKHEWETSNYWSRWWRTMTGRPWASATWPPHWVRNTAKWVLKYYNTTTSREPRCWIRGRKNGNRYELVSAVRELHNPNWCNQMLITNGRKQSFYILIDGHATSTSLHVGRLRTHMHQCMANPP